MSLNQTVGRGLWPMRLKRNVPLLPPLRIVWQIHGLRAIQVKHDAVAMERRGERMPLVVRVDSRVVAPGAVTQFRPRTSEKPPVRFSALHLHLVAGQRRLVSPKEEPAVPLKGS